MDLQSPEQQTKLPSRPSRPAQGVIVEIAADPRQLPSAEWMLPRPQRKGRKQPGGALVRLQNRTSNLDRDLRDDRTCCVSLARSSPVRVNSACRSAEQLCKSSMRNHFRIKTAIDAPVSSIMANRNTTSTRINTPGTANVPSNPNLSYKTPPTVGPSKPPHVNAIVVCPIASPTLSGGTLSATIARPTTHTAVAERPCRPRAIINRVIERARTKRIVDEPSAASPIMKGRRRRRQVSAK